MIAAQKGIEELRANCDTVLVILNDKLREIYGNLAIRQAFGKADNILSTAAKSIAEIITVHQDVNVDFEDVKTVMKDAGAAVMGSATEEGEGRAIKAAAKAIASPLLNNVDITGAQKILLSIMSGEEEELSMDELSEITEYIQERAGDIAEVIFGQGIDPDLKKGIRVTVIATGFEADSLTETEKLASRVKEEDNSKKLIHLESGKTSRIEEEDVARAGQTFTFSIQKAAPTPSISSSPQQEKKPEPVAQQIPQDSDEREEDLEESEMEYQTPEPKKVMSLFEKREEEKPSIAKREDTQNNNNYNNDYYEQIKEKAMRRAHERFERIRQMRALNQTPEEFKEKLETPAYMRKNVKLQDVKHSSESNLSKYNLNDDNEILGNNRFLHDNVD